MITVIGIFEDGKPAEEAVSYLLGNEFEEQNIDLHTGDTERLEAFFAELFEDEQAAAAHTAAAKNATIVTVHALDTREAQEAADVLSNYGAMEISIPGSDNALSRIVEKAVNSGVRLRGI
jgi:hypothetical protein